MGVWFLIIVIIMLGHLELRKSIINVIKKACTIQLLRPFLLILLYLLISILLFKELSIWKWIYLKDIITWFIFAGVPVTFKAIYSKAEDHYFRKMFIDNIRLIVLEEGVVNDNQKSQLSYSNYKCY